MAKYLVTVSYTAAGAAGLRKDGGTKRRSVAAKAVESVGGKLETFYFARGGEHEGRGVGGGPTSHKGRSVNLCPR